MRENQGNALMQFYKRDLITSLNRKERNTSTPTVTSFRYFLKNRGSLSIKRTKGYTTKV
jgi:hypothetical protein